MFGDHSPYFVKDARLYADSQDGKISDAAIYNMHMTPALFWTSGGGRPELPAALSPFMLSAELLRAAGLPVPGWMDDGERLRAGCAGFSSMYTLGADGVSTDDVLAAGAVRRYLM
jgi:hypothetical protein